MNKGIESMLINQLKEDRPYDYEHCEHHIRKAIRKVVNKMRKNKRL